MPQIDTTKFTPDNSFSINGIMFWDAGASEVYNRFNTQATRTLVCKWGERIQLINTLSPGGTSVTGTLSSAAQPYPDAPGLYPQEFRVRGEGVMGINPAGMINYQYAIIECIYEPYNGGDINLDVSANIITLPQTGPCLETVESVYKGKKLDVPFQDTPGYPLTVIQLTQGRNNVPVLPIAAILSCSVNPLNDSTFLGADPGTVIFQGAQARKISTTNLSINSGLANNLAGPYDITYRFLARPALAWDKLPIRLPDGTFIIAQVQFKNGQGKFLGRSDFDSLFH